MRSVLCLLMLIALTWAGVNPAIAQDRPTWDTPKPQAPQIAPASDEPQQALGTFRIPEGMIGSVFAAEPDVANAVAIYVDHQGKVWVCESFRQSKGIEDNRGHEHWLDDDLAARTVQDRYDYVVKHVPDAPRTYTEQDDRIRLLVDTDGDQVADRVTVFADGFNELVAGTGAGVLEYRGDVFYTCIPDLWLLRDEDGDGVADERKSLHYGYGVRYAFRGHDMHGLVIGPDGRLYFSIGDRGYNVPTSDGLGENPDSGAVFRCELDGSRLEVFAMGLRNPQELAFDEFGNLFTGDNNSDSGDRARWVHVVQGGDSGWRMFYQYLPDRGPFNREFLWHPARPEQPAYLVPPVTNFADGPSGLAYYPGTGLSDDFRGRFLLCDFRGQASNSGIRSLRVKPKGASFELVDDQQPFWNILATDVTFGPDGAMYVADWVHGWEGLGKGRVYRFVDAAASKSEIVQQVQQLLREGLAEHDENSLTTLLAHPDQRVRQEAQFELARRGAFEALDGVARNHRNTLARLHAIWGLGQLGRRDERRDETVETIAELLRAKDAEVRAQAATVMGDLEDLSYGEELTRLLADESPRVRSFAALAIGRLGLVSAAPSVAQLLSDNADSDAVLRHSGAMALAGIARNQPQLVRDLATHPSVAVRRAAVVALRRVDLVSTAAFLNDADVLVVEEAARALHDAPRETDLTPLAAIIDRPTDSDALLRRVLNANFRLGGPERAAALAAFVARGGGQESHRIEALEMLATWSSPGVRDRVIGMHRPIAERDATDAVQALDQNLPLILSQGGAVAEKAVDAAARLGIEAVAPRLIERVGDASLEPAQRASALRALGQLKSDQLQQLALAHVQSDAEPLRIVSLDLLAGLDLSAALPHLKQAVASPSVAERQAAIATLRRFESPETRQLIEGLAQPWLDGSLPVEIGLDVFEAISALPEGISKPVIDKYRASLNESDPLAPYRLTIAGGNVDRGRTLFYERASLSCIRCHAVNGSGGNVGPELGRIGLDKQPEYLLEAIVAPNQAIAKGFEGVLVQTLDGGTLSGIVRSQTDEELTLINAEGNLIRIAMDDVDQIVPGKSSMPEDLMKYLTLSELRDLVAYLASLRNEEASSAHGAETP